MIIKESKLQKGLPKETQSLCPECACIIDATIVERDGKVMMEKKCPEHGYFEDIYFSDASLYHRMEGHAHDGVGVENPYYTDATECPTDCGLCQMHLSHTVLANVDLTNRCNLKCPICFANANAQGFIWEPDYDEVVEMLAVLRRNSPVPTPSVQFAGGEPTVYPHFIEAVRAAHELGFAQIQVATNGVRMAQEPGFTQAMASAGVHTVYLQFDGFDDEMYREVRGKPMVDIKQRAIDSVREAQPNMSICLVPTLVNTVNDDIVGDIVRYAIDNSDLIHAINFQPVAFTGRIDKSELAQKRFTLADLVHRLVDQTDFLKEEHFYPVPSVSVFSELASVWQNDP
ncbi:MAG: radical SAM protein, partial [Thermoplasmata archaeon]|nr:radical SAM protein [Thermoplasmata archaeon]